MLVRAKAGSYITFFLFVALTAHAQGDTFPMPDSVLLFARYDQGLVLVTPENSFAIHTPSGASRTRPVGIASLGQTGRLVSSGFPVADDPSKRWGVRCAIGVYSVAEEKWRTFGDYNAVITTTVSPDGSAVAFYAEETTGNSRALFLLDVNSGQITKLGKDVGPPGNWSADGKKLALHISYAKAPRIAVYDIASGSLRELGEGIFPAWSPFGEWIAYIDASGQRVRLVHPDGTGDRVIKDVHNRVFGYRYFGLAPVWSPDSTRLLLNEYKGDGDYQDVVMLDIKTGKITKKSTNGLPVTGWASSSTATHLPSR